MNNSSMLLTSKEPLAFEIINPNSNGDVMLVCEHASNLIPQKLDNLGLNKDDLKKHIAYDIGARDLTIKIANSLNILAIVQNYSRLVIDGNRIPRSLDSIPLISDNINIPKNKNLSKSDIDKRVDEVFAPFDKQVKNLIIKHKPKLILSIHSYTPIMNNIKRPWDIGFLFDKDAITSTKIASVISSIDKNLTIGMNEPYIVDDTDWFVSEYGEKTNTPHSLVEIKNSHIKDKKGVSKWAKLLSQTITKYLKD